MHRARPTRRRLSTAIALACLAAGGLGACAAFLGTGPHVPGAYQGATPITVVNGGDRDICAFAIFNNANENENWLGTKGKQEVLAPGQRRTFNIKPGTYHVLAGFCQDGQFLAACGTYGAETATIQGPSTIVMGRNQVAAAPGTQTLTFTKFYYVQQGGGGGEAAPAETSESTSTASDESSTSDESSSSESSESTSPESSGATTSTNPNCRPSGATCDQSYQCCSNACITHSPDDYCR